VDDYYFE
jgi:glycogen debranching enzyme